MICLDMYLFELVLFSVCLVSSKFVHAQLLVVSDSL